jgi:hypothetical protein
MSLKARLVMADHDLQKRLEKLGEQLVSDIERWEQRTRGDRAQRLNQLSHSLESKVGEAFTRIAEQSARAKVREEDKARRRQAREARRHQQPTTAGGVVMLTIAALCAVMGVVNPNLFWMVFVALGLGLGGARQLTEASRRRPERVEGEPPMDVKLVQQSAPAPHEVDALCDTLLAELAQAPQTVRTFISEPQQTVASMRATLKSLNQRRQQLLAEDAKGRLAAAAQQRAELQQRVDGTQDPETRHRLEDALHSMASQASALEQLLVMTERVDGEYTALLIHLQELRTRVSLAKSSGSTVQLEGVKASVQRGELSPISAEPASGVDHQSGQRVKA